MISLGFNNEFVNPVKEGVKTSTIRKHFNGKIGDKIEAYNYDNVIFERLKELRKEEQDCIRQLMK